MTDLAEVIVALKRLGGTPDAIAQSLREKGIKGMCGSGSECPISRFIRAETGADNVCTDGSSVRVSDGPGSVLSYTNDDINRFVHCFDRHHYPDLIDVPPVFMPAKSND